MSHTFILSVPKWRQMRGGRPYSERPPVESRLQRGQVLNYTFAFLRERKKKKKKHWRFCAKGVARIMSDARNVPKASCFLSQMASCTPGSTLTSWEQTQPFSARWGQRLPCERISTTPDGWTVTVPTDQRTIHASLGQLVQHFLCYLFSSTIQTGI